MLQAVVDALNKVLEWLFHIRGKVNSASQRSRQKTIANDVTSIESNAWFQIEHSCERGHEMMRNPYVRAHVEHEFWICPQCGFQLHIHKHPHVTN